MVKKVVVKKKLPAILCKGCDMIFVPKVRGQKYHDAECRDSYYDRTYFRREITNLQCPNCGTTFPTTKAGRQIYCTPDCRIEAQAKRRENLTIGTEGKRHQFYGDRYKQMEADGFACRQCGKEPRDGIKLDVERDGKGGYITICNQCSEGRKAK